MTALSGHEPQIKISIPAAASRLLGALRRAGFEAYVVGGCVRDSLLGRTPGDWDICTSARPEQVRTVFSAYRQILTGEKHGTVAVIVGGTPYEITTYRVDGQYHDSRHPDAVQFVPQVQPDLARRDFTINAMAYAPGEGLIDLYGGRSDLHACLMRCVGNPEERFAEDALRILRAVRLAAQLDFALEKATERAALDMRQSIQNISAERIYTELDKLLAAPAAGKVLSRYGRILAGAVPEIEPCIGCTQPGRWHCYDVWQHTAVAVELLDVAGMDDKMPAFCGGVFFCMIWPSRNAAPSARTAQRISPATTRPEVKWRAASCCGSRRLLILWKAPARWLLSTMVPCPAMMPAS